MQDQESVANVYLDQVLQQQKKVDRELRRKSRSVMPSSAGAPAPGEPEVGARTRAVDYRITGMWRWKTVIVPPNAYVVHTRRGHADPIHIGQGISFGYNPYTDAFLVVPAAMQTIVINANSICIERQGILVQAYVQWIIDDITTAYRRLDFSDPEDPMEIVNVQLREQAEAAIKDKVATMSIDEVLSDKQPIIEELTHRLRTVAEGSRDGDGSGLGLKIVTVQIKEAVVSSGRLWQNLQLPFRAERAQIARLAELASEETIAKRELENHQSHEEDILRVEAELARLRGETEAARFNRDHDEQVRRQGLEQTAQRQALDERKQTTIAEQTAELESTLHGLHVEKQRIEREVQQLEARLALDDASARRAHAHASAEIELSEMRDQARATWAERALVLRRHERDIDNDLSAEHLQATLIGRLPEIAKALPIPKELRAVTVSSNAGALGPVTELVAGATAALDALRGRPAAE